MDEIHQHAVLYDAVEARRAALVLLRDDELRHLHVVANKLLRAVADRHTQVEIQDLAREPVNEEHKQIEAQLLATATRLYISGMKTKRRVTPSQAVHDAKDLMFNARYYRKANHMSGSYPDV